MKKRLVNKLVTISDPTAREVILTLLSARARDLSGRPGCITEGWKWVARDGEWSGFASLLNDTHVIEMQSGPLWTMQNTLTGSGFCDSLENTFRRAGAIADVAMPAWRVRARMRLAGLSHAAIDAAIGVGSIK